MVTGAAVPHARESGAPVVPHLREAEVDALIDGSEEGQPIELPADSPVPPQGRQWRPIL